MGTFNLRLDDDTHKKLQEIANRQSRSQNKQVEFIVKQFIADFEKINGKIETKNIPDPTEIDFRARNHIKK
ncbi:TraY domain-containing protein [Anaerotruncus rubiinfantis]|uniref:TraY domain-containing protein n=1 Tax=Anaerotruncus rubiinfantis TaxID=1720200 RepID=UPI0034A4E73F